jgi:hypothetical protein
VPFELKIGKGRLCRQITVSWLSLAIGAFICRYAPARRKVTRLTVTLSGSSVFPGAFCRCLNALKQLVLRTTPNWRPKFTINTWPSASIVQHIRLVQTCLLQLLTRTLPSTTPRSLAINPYQQQLFSRFVTFLSVFGLSQNS